MQGYLQKFGSKNRSLKALIFQQIEAIKDVQFVKNLESIEFSEAEILKKEVELE